MCFITSLNGTNMTQQMSQQFALLADIQDNSLVQGACDWSVFCLMIGCCRGTAVEYLGGTGSVSGKAAVSHLLFGTPERASLRIPSALMQIKARVLSYQPHYSAYLPLRFTDLTVCVNFVGLYLHKNECCILMQSTHPPSVWSRLQVASTGAISPGVEIKIAG